MTGLIDWLMPWRRELRRDKPFKPVDAVDQAVAASLQYQATSVQSVKSSVDAIQRQQASGLVGRLLVSSEQLRLLANETIDRTKG